MRVKHVRNDTNELTILILRVDAWSRVVCFLFETNILLLILWIIIIIRSLNNRGMVFFSALVQICLGRCMDGGMRLSRRLLRCNFLVYN